jgi:thymidylate synthase (FAD)
MQIDKDRGFLVEVDRDATSPNIQRSCWKGGHRTLDPTNWLDHPIKSETAGNGIIKHQLGLGGKRGHYSSLCFAFIKLEIIGFPHSVHDQFVRHRDSSFNNMAFLVSSNRLDNNLFIQVADGVVDIETVFYHRPVGQHRSRDGANFVITQEDRDRYFNDCLKSCETYTYRVREQGWSGEVARDALMFGFRQNWTIAGTLEAFWHMLDQRSKADSQQEAVILAAMIHAELMELCPELQQWYDEHRYGKAILAP